MVEFRPSRDVFISPSLTIGRFRCPPGHQLWRSENQVVGNPIVVFPRVPVRITQAGRPSVVADPNCVMFYNSGQEYRRGLLSERGDICEYFGVAPEVLADAAAEFDQSIRDHPSKPFAFPSGPSDAQAYLRQRTLFEYVASRQCVDPILVQEAFFGVLRDVFAAAFRASGAPRASRRSQTARCHAETAESAKELLARRFNEALLLEDIAEEVCCSPFHLCRIFRRHTGFSMHAYIDQLRLRAALERLVDSSEDLTTLALNLGYSSHAHFTLAFRRAYGLTPSATRGGRSPTHNRMK